MRPFIVLLVLVFTSFAQISAQPHEKAFTLNGQINIDTGVIKLIAAGNGTYYPSGLEFYTAQVKDGSFSFSDSLPYPCAFRLLLISGGDYLSDYFFIDPGQQKIVCNTDSSRKIPQLSNASMKELSEGYGRSGRAIVPSSPANEPGRARIRQDLFRYTVDHPGSYVALWKTVMELKYDYSGILDSIYSKFSASLQNTYTGVVLGQHLHAMRNTSIGSHLPALELTDGEYKKIRFSFDASRNKFIFVDFWFSHCTPCLNEFPRIKKTYDVYKSKGFEIVAISTDFQKDIPAWRKVIAERALNWTQLLDLDGKESRKLSIESFPTNFLLDEHGVIIQKNLSPEELESFLFRNLP